MKKFLYGLIALMFILPISLGFVACKKTYTLNYMVDGKVYQSVQINSDQTIQEIEEPTKDGYDFVGWFISETAEDEYEFGKTIDSNINLYARWDAIEYTITYELNGGTNATVNKTKYTVEDAVTLAPATKDGFRFAGWYSNASFEGTPVVTIAKGTQGNKKFYANWEADNYTISYNLNGGAIDESANPTTYTYNSATITLANPTKTADEDYDYEFGGWYDNPDFNGEAILTIPEHSSGNKVLFAKWNITQSRLTINYEDINGKAVAEMYSAKVAVGQAYSVNSPVVTGYGYTPDQATVEGTMGTTKVMLTVVYRPVDYNITYELDGGTNNSDNPATYTILEEVVLANPTKDYYDFLGWYTNAALTESTTGITIGSHGSVTFYAKWQPTQYTITLTNYDEQTIQVQYTCEDRVVAPTLAEISFSERNGYEFVGWKVASGAQGSWEELVGQPISVGDKTPAGAYGDVTLEAQYSVITYTISYDLDDGTIAESNPTSYTVEDETITLAEPTKAHYDFNGWFNATDTEHLVKITQINCANEVGNKSLVAYFTATNYNINYHIDEEAGEINNSNLPQYTYFMPDINLNPAIKVVNDVEYTFIGWYDNPEFTGTPVTKIATNSEGDKDLYPKWELQISSAANLVKAV